MFEIAWEASCQLLVGAIAFHPRNLLFFRFILNSDLSTSTAADPGQINPVFNPNAFASIHQTHIATSYRTGKRSLIQRSAMLRDRLAMIFGVVNKDSQDNAVTFSVISLIAAWARRSVRQHHSTPDRFI